VVFLANALPIGEPVMSWIGLRRVRNGGEHWSSLPMISNKALMLYRDIGPYPGNAGPLIIHFLGNGMVLLDEIYRLEIEFGVSLMERGSKAGMDRFYIIFQEEVEGSSIDYKLGLGFYGYQLPMTFTPLWRFCILTKVAPNALRGVDGLVNDYSGDFV